MKSVLLVFGVVLGVVLAAPAGEDLQKKIDAMEKHIQLLEKALLQRRSPLQGSLIEGNQIMNPRATRALAFQPMKRMVAWQPMKRSIAAEYNKDQVIRAIEEQLLEILHAGETLGVNAEEVLGDLKKKNGDLM
ncbi:unnamed protein product [Bursaphelenchus xylophilus]|uniref:(pine wood nematode) hypothetical protein n=1 Tax=Bursaphelenchus xylophilus TaxID=6326 RepID=A0A1I7RLE1_BURXY|nr:unnamed protein product [Bursaphelenchus xylophilus]CAG9083098.1 unnamed protein product [Bursaphelenchus xylophilus]